MSNSQSSLRRRAASSACAAARDAVALSSSVSGGAVSTPRATIAAAATVRPTSTSSPLVDERTIGAAGLSCTAHGLGGIVLIGLEGADP